MLRSERSTDGGSPSVRAISPDTSQWMAARALTEPANSAEALADAVDSMVRRPPTSSPSKSENSGALAVQPDQRSKATQAACPCAASSRPVTAAMREASHAVRAEWSIGWPMLRSPTNARALMASKTWMWEAGGTAKEEER